MISEKAHKALCYLRDFPKSSASSFAEYMWPDHNMHRKSSNQGNGATRGKAAWLCAGSYIGRLKKAGFVSQSYSYISEKNYYITSVGHQAIKEFENSIKK